MFVKSSRRSVKLLDRSHERDYWRTVEQIVHNQVLQIQERIVKGCGRTGPHHPKSRCASGTLMPSTNHPDSSEDSGGSTCVVLSLSDRCTCCDAATSVIEAESLEHEAHVPSFNQAQQLKATDFA